MKYINKKEKFKKITLIKKGLGVAILASSILMSGCSSQENNKDYYLVTENNKSYICTKTEQFINYHDYDFVSIVDNKVIGSICPNGSNFDYSTHRLTTNFLCELQTFPLKKVFEDENLDDNILNDEEKLADFAMTDNLNNIRINYYAGLKYELIKNFIYSEDSKLELFVLPDDITIGYDISPKKRYKKYQYIYSIDAMDVIKINKYDNVENIGISGYLKDEQKNRGYITYNEAIEIVNNYIDNHYSKRLIIK